MKIDKRKCRKFADPGLKMDLNNGLLHAGEIKHIIKTAVKNIGGQRILILYVCSREKAASGDFCPVWTVFQGRKDYATLARREDGSTQWRSAAFHNLGNDYNFEKYCAFYTLGDEERVRKFCGKEGKSGTDSLFCLQTGIMRERRNEKQLQKETAIIKKMKTVPPCPRDLKTVIKREAMPSYVFYTYHKGKKPMEGYCTACDRTVQVTGARHNGKGTCPGCRAAVIFKSRGKRGYISDRGTLQLFQRISGNEIVLRFFKAYYTYYMNESSDKHIFESARIFIRWDGEGKIAEDWYYCSHESRDILTPWKCGDRPAGFRWQYNFLADSKGFLYSRKLEAVLKDTPWQYSQLKAYCLAAGEPVCAITYLRQYRRYPVLEYLVKLRLDRLARGIASGHGYGYGYGTDKAVNYEGKNLKEVLGLDRSFLPLLQRINPGEGQMRIIKGLLNAGMEPDEELLCWCGENNVSGLENLTVPLQYMTPHKLMRYADGQFAALRRKNFSDGGYYSMEYLLGDYRDYLCMSDALGYDMKNSFVVFPANLKTAHDKVNDLSDKEQALAYDRQIQKMSDELESKYRFSRFGFVMVPPRSAKEIVEEGHALHHCVGGYVKDIVRRETTILFVREEKEPEKPLCTVEVKNGKVVQARVYKNGAPSPKIRKFLDVWEEKVLRAPILAKAA